jgi:integrase
MFRPDKKSSSAVTHLPKRNSGVTVVVKTNVERLRLPDVDDANQARWFSNFVDWMMKSGPTELTERQLLIGTVLATEAVVNKESLTRALLALRNVRHDEDGPYVTWTTGDSTDRLRISQFTAIAARQIRDWPNNWDCECEIFFSYIATKFTFRAYADHDDLARHFFDGAMQWFHCSLPPPCANHLSKTLQLTLLPQVVLDRRVGIRPPAPTNDIRTGALNPLADMAVDQLYGSAVPKYKSKLVVVALKGLFLGESEGSIRLADYLEKRKLQADLARISKALLHSGCPINALIVLWVVHLFEWGSVRLKDPTTGTIRRYIFAIVDLLFDALHALSFSPADISDELWAKFFSDMVKAEGMDSVGKNALLSFHRFLVLQFGIEPVANVFSGGSEAAVPSANVLWPHEREKAFALIPDFTSDTRLQKMLSGLFAFGSGRPVRIGELPGMRWRCINSKNGKLRVDFSPSRGQHKGKSKAAARPLDYTDSPTRSHIEEWLKYRERDGIENDDELVFGDPNRPGRCYRLGLCLRLVNQILKEATGDLNASFHMLRHTVICDELRADLVNAESPTSIKHSHQVAASAGHQNDLTTYSNYFHTPEPVIRFWLDKALAKYRNSAAVLGAWLKTLPNSLTKFRSSHGHQDNCFDELLRQAAGQVRASSGINLSQFEVPKVVRVPFANGEGSFQQILFVLNGLYAGKSLSVVASRNDTTPEWIVQICRNVIEVANKAVSHQKRQHISLNANDDFVVQSARVLIESVFCFYPIREPILAGPLAVVQATPEIRSAVAAWYCTKQGKYLSMRDPDAVVPLASFLVGAGVPASNFYLAVAVKDPANSTLLNEVLHSVDVIRSLSVFERLAGTSLQVVAVCKAKGRPNLYLMLSRNRIAADKACAPAEARTNRLHALMLAIAVWIEISK